MMLKRLLRNLSRGGLPASGNNNQPAHDARRHFELAEDCVARRLFGQAEHHYRDAIGCDPESAALRYNLGLLLHEVGDLAGAEACYRDALALSPDDQAVQSSLL